MGFEWNDSKNAENISKHGLSFYEAQEAFFDESRVILIDVRHSAKEKRYFCIGKTVRGGIATVRFTIRNGQIRIFGAGYWRKGKKIYEQRS
ncbi:MAG TPA: BrnT family toxin [Candidatus Saccharimonadia bacterium]|nr:BrnT family toxin [Candidatus Saccharimonadia bacterium]